MATSGAATTSSEKGSGEECIRVVARVRPSDCPSDNIVLKKAQVDITVPHGSDVINNTVEEYNFKFARTFGAEATQEDVFNGTARDLVLGALDGVNCTVFAYGQTGSGKTHTICGNHSHRGIIPRSLGCLFDAIDRKQDGVEYSVSMSFIEVYKEVGYDLLAKEVPQNMSTWPVVTVAVRNDQPVLHGAKRVAIASEEEGLHQYFLGDTHRCVAETPHNLNSSRSHCVFTIFIEASDPAAQTVRTSKVQIVDLAGSERLKPYEAGSQDDKVLMGQAIAINMSLHWLECVINALNRKEKTQIPYRYSFLTKVLKDALGGNARAVMVCTINPSDAALPETLSSCRFAMRVANVQTYSKVNEEKDPQLIIAALRQENGELRAALAAAGTAGGGEAPAASDDGELRKRARAFLEGGEHRGKEEEGEGGGATMQVGSMLEAFKGFRILRDLFWEMLRGRGGSRGGNTSARSDRPDGESEPLTAASSPTPREGQSARAVQDRSPGTPDGDSAAAPEKAAPPGEPEPEPHALRRQLDEREGELRMLRAALAAQPQRPAKPARPPPPPRARSVSVSTQTEAMPTIKKPQKQKRPSSADPRPRETQKFIGFSPEDVVDRFASTRQQDSAKMATTVAARPTDPRVPDFRNLSKAEGGSDSRRPEPLRTEQLGGSSGSNSRPSGAGGASTPPPLPVTTPPSARGSPAGGSGAAAVLRNINRRDSAPALVEQPAAQPKKVVETAAGGTQEAAAKPPEAKKVGGASAAWLVATTALTAEELRFMGDAKQAYQMFLRHDPRAVDIWPNELQSMRTEKRERMAEARALGEEIERTKEATSKVQSAITSLKGKLQEAEAEAAVDPGAAQRANKLRELLATEEPKLTQLFDEKRQRYELDFARLKELRRDISHLEHGEKKLESTVQAEFSQWRQAVAQRYPDAVKAAEAAAAAGTGPTLQPAAPPGATGGSPEPTSEQQAATPRARAASPARPPAAAVSPEARAAPPPASADDARPAGGAPAVTAAPAGPAAPAPAAPANTGPSPQALATAEAALASLRQRLEEAKAAGDERRQQMLEKLLAVEEPRLAALRAASQG